MLGANPLQALYLLDHKTRCIVDGVLPVYALRMGVRKLISSREASIRRTLDFNRPYQDIVLKRGSYVMEDWLHFTETFSVAVLAEDQNGDQLLPEPFAEMWAHLRNVILRYFRASRSEDTATVE